MLSARPFKISQFYLNSLILFLALCLQACGGIPGGQDSFGSCTQNSVLSELDDNQVLVGDMILPASEVFNFEDLKKFWPDRALKMLDMANVSFGTTSQFLTLWDNGIIPIVMDSNEVSADLRARIFSACAKISAVANVTCVERTNETHFIRATTSGSGCFATIGRTVNGVINLEGNCNQEAIIIHELMHNLGVRHEQQHPDRDAFVRVIPENVQANRISNFTLISSGGVLTDFDFDSVMIYRSDAFAINRSFPALVRRSPACDAIARTGFPNNCLIPFNRNISSGDAEILSTLYGAPGAPPVSPTPPAPPVNDPGNEQPEVCNLTI